MLLTLPKISNQIFSKDILYTINKNYTTVQPIWVPIQMEWMNNLYRTFYDYHVFNE